MRCPICGSKDCCGGELNQRVDRLETELAELIAAAEATTAAWNINLGQEMLESYIDTLRDAVERVREVNGMTDIKFNSNGQERMSIDGHLRSLGTESPTTKLRWFNPFPYDRRTLQQEWVNQNGETEWRDVPTE